ncbi:hypothetical protein KGM_200852 [Danaus plexippus plexippus]|uniref:Uncharacterized protein n=1 Tax=Danaus plexippus plexippus TaxID=278856 RepID=A0A212EHQ5_DANPL|nr:hypothetical protein KGM_200852 [Danaus plexippus plexippus]
MCVMLDYRRTAGLFPRPPDLHQYKEQLLVCGLRLAFSRPYALRIKDQVSVPLHLLSRLSAMNKTTDSFPYSLTSIVLLKQIASRGYARPFRLDTSRQQEPVSRQRQYPGRRAGAGALKILNMTSGTVISPHDEPRRCDSSLPRAFVSLPRAPLGRYIKIPPKKLEQKIFSKGRHGFTDPLKIEDPSNYPAGRMFQSFIEERSCYVEESRKNILKPFVTSPRGDILSDMSGSRGVVQGITGRGR